ncbi:MAG: pyridoxal-phosphate dependent enzyme [Acidimicrobiia bacterium]|nr:pyridoxal-phosphate dependent enzyme [Acidimicrobiia bacterium]
MAETRPTGWPGGPVEPPRMADVEDAARRLEGTIVRTPLVPLLDHEHPTDIWLKPEVLQPIGSFKVRGVGNWALSLDPAEAARGLATTSAGNTAQALGYMGRVLGVPSRSMVPNDLHGGKRQAIEAYGTELVGVSMTDLMLYMFEERWRDEPYAYLNPWGEPKMIAGHGTIGLEVFEDLPEVDSVFVPVGGGALVSGVASVLRFFKPEIRVYAVQAEVNSALAAAFEAGGPVWIEWNKTVVEGASTPVITHNMYPMLRNLIDEVVLVSESEVMAAIRRLMLNDKLVTEGAGAASVAGALKVPAAERGMTVCVVSGASVDPGLLHEVLSGV